VRSRDNKRSGRRIALLALSAQPDPAMPLTIPNHGVRMVAAALAAARLPDMELRIYDMRERDPLGLFNDLLAYDPDVIGFSCYLWSLPEFADLARTLHRDDPRRLLVFGGPSARPSMLSLPPFRDLQGVVDVLVLNEGEHSMVEIVALKERTPQALAQIAGLALPVAGGWKETMPRELGDLNELASPYVMDLSPHRGIGVLQTYRGCPLTCSFCEWGTLGSPRRVREVDNLTAELNAMARHEVNGALLVDAALNLNNHAFANLHEASKRSGFFNERHLICEVHPAKLRQEHLDFLSLVARPMVGIGLQSFDDHVLESVERNHDQTRFDETLHQLIDVSSVALEIILGLPEDDPETFLRTFERARSLPCALRVYHCVVLPSALMVRAPAHYNMDYDPYTLKIRSCSGWSEQRLNDICEFLNRETERAGGARGEFFWVFPPPGR
jgi:radical SAM superfamily enzyme YgiQ (UPF0313 family)